MAQASKGSVNKLLRTAKTSGNYSSVLSPENIEKMIWETLVAMEGQAALLSPVDSGLLRDSITIATNQRNDTFGPRAITLENEVSAPSEDYVGVIGTAVEYAAAVEYGRPDMPLYPAQPFLRPTLDWIKMKLGRIAGDELRKRFAEYSNRHPWRGKASRDFVAGLNK